MTAVVKYNCRPRAYKSILKCIVEEVPEDLLSTYWDETSNTGIFVFEYKNSVPQQLQKYIVNTTAAEYIVKRKNLEEKISHVLEAFRD
jgi:hypothetical protein